MLKSTSSRVRAALLGALCVGLVAGSAQAGKEPSAEVKRLLFPAREALGLDSLALADKEARKALALDPAVTETHLLLGEVAWRRGDLKIAREMYQKAKDLGGAEAEAQAGLSLVAFASDDLAGAAAAANAALAADKGSWMANYAYGRVLVAQNKPQEAFKVFEKGKNLKGRGERRDLFDTGMGLVALAENDADGAQTSFIKARAQAPNTIEHTMNLCNMLESTGQWGQATIALQQAEAKVGSSPLLTFRMGRAAENQRQFNDALRLYQKAAAADSAFMPAQAAIGHLYLLDPRRAAQAAEILAKVVAIKPTYQVRLDLGTALTRLNKAPEAIAHLEAAQKENDTVEVKLALARAYAAADLVDKSLPLYNDVDVAMEASAGDLVVLARALVKAKRYDEAAPFLDKASEKDDKNSDVFYVRGLVALGKKDLPGALENFQKKTEMDPKSPLGWMQQASVLSQMGKQKEAIEAYRRATEAAPNAAAIWVAYGQALTAANQLPEAEAAFDKALALEPASLEAKKGKGLIKLLQDKYPEAIGLLKDVTQAKPDDAEAWTTLGQAYLNAQKLTEARQALQQALKLDPNNKSAQESLKLLDGAAGSR